MNIRILEIIKDISKKDEFINAYNLKFIGKYKCYKIFDTYITSDGNKIIFEKHKYKNDKEYYIENISPFSFYDISDEFIYDKYMNENYILKCYENNLILEFIDK
jgi:hypothetical protein